MGLLQGRFLCPLFNVIQVDPETGGIYMKKGELWLNTFTRELTYLFWCNTDVTNLSSGTAIKAVVLYVSDYIMKASLKTHIVFDCILSIFLKNAELIQGSLSSQEKACVLMTKIVNLLTTKMEMGALMVCMYLLGNPDHYTNHSFIPFYWQNFVTEARWYWHPDDPHTVPQKVTLMKKNSRVVGMSPVYDYIFRGDALADMSLYEWARWTEHTTLKSAKKKSSKKHTTSPDEDVSFNNSFESHALPEPSFVFENDSLPELSMDGVPPLQFNNDIPIEDAAQLCKSCFQLHPSHPLYQTHSTYVRKPMEYSVVNFVSATLPCHDQGNCEYYCSTMLALFKPWRSGKDLKKEGFSWHLVFEEHTFTNWEIALMNNFNLHYECLDAWDDYRAQLKAGHDIETSWGNSVKEWLDDLLDNNDGVNQMVFSSDNANNRDVEPDMYDLANMVLHPSAAYT